MGGAFSQSDSSDPVCTKDKCEELYDLPVAPPQPKNPQILVPTAAQCQKFIPSVPANLQKLMLSSMKEGPSCTKDLKSYQNVENAFACSVLCGLHDQCEASQYKVNKELCWLKSGCTGGSLGELPTMNSSDTEFAQWYKKP